jgi:transposase
MKREQLECLSKEELIDIILLQFEKITELTQRVAELEAQVNANSRNSGKPPSSDGLSKPNAKSLREKTGRKPGGQKGHKGHGLKIEREADEVIRIEPIACPGCGSGFAGVESVGVDTKYVYDVQIEMKLIRYEICAAVCPVCGMKVEGKPPEDCNGTLNYGSTIRTLAVILTQYACVGIDKTRKILRDLLGVPISGGTIKNIQRQFAGKAEPTIAEIKENLHVSPILNVDETGGRIAGKTQWFHVASNNKYTLLTAHGKRGKEGSEAGEVLPEYEGVLVHDCWKPYFGFDKSEHALCCAHLLRELNALIEQGQHWAFEMKALLLEMKNAVDRYKSEDKATLSRYYKVKFEKRYDDVLTLAESEIIKSTTRKKSKAENLLTRLEQYRTEVTRFTDNFDVPFDNNQAERDVRNVKVKQKVSGGFRTTDGARDYAGTASIIGTAVKHGFSVVHAVRNLFDGRSPLLGDATE